MSQPTISNNSYTQFLFKENNIMINTWKIQLLQMRAMLTDYDNGLISMVELIKRDTEAYKTRAGLYLWFINARKDFQMLVNIPDDALLKALYAGVSWKDLEQMDWEVAISEIPEQMSLYVFPFEEEPNYE